jgi:hypothetical protein
LYSENAGGGSRSPQDLIEKAARIRAEIAALEGKSVAQVQQEAVEKKQREEMARDAADRQRTANEALLRQTSKERLGRAVVQVPESRLDMVRQCARAIERAVADGQYRQTVRLALLETEEQSIYDANNNMWPGGAEQMSRRAAKPTTIELFQELRLGTTNNNNNSKKPVVTVEDVWDFDGSAMVRRLDNNDNDNVDVVMTAQALVFANTDVKYTRDIQALLVEQQKLKQQQQEPLLLLVNPFWRDIDSWGINILAPGAKRLAQQVIFDDILATETYSCRRFQCRGEECIAIKAYPYDWQIFAYLEDGYGGMMNTIRLGECPDEPKTPFVTELLNGRSEFKLSRTMRQMRR